MDECADIVKGDGLCETHLRRKRLHGDPGSAERRPWTHVQIAVGETFGYWTALESAGKSSQRIRCRCKCGRERLVMARNLTNDITRSCGCGPRRHGRRRTTAFMLAGTTMGRLTALEDAWSSADRISFLCECGSLSERVAKTVAAGSAQSCGCARRELSITHSLSKHELYRTWRAMIARCEHPTAHNFPAYGGRGIRVCEEWRHSPDGLIRFIAHVGPRPEGMTLDRIDVDGNYEPGNVRWATVSQQNANRRSIAALTTERDMLRAQLAAALARLSD